MKASWEWVQRRGIQECRWTTAPGADCEDFKYFSVLCHMVVW